MDRNLTFAGYAWSLSESTIDDSHHSDSDSEQHTLRENVLVESRGEARHHDTQRKHDCSWHHENSWTIGVKYSPNKTTLTKPERE